MTHDVLSTERLRTYRNTRLYRSLTRTLRVYNRLLIQGLHDRGFTDFSPSFPQVLSNLDTEGTRLGVIAERAGITRQAVGQMLSEIERCGYAERRTSPHDRRATIVHFTPRGRELLAAVFELVDQIEQGFAERLGEGRFDAVRSGLAELAGMIDPVGAFGCDDQ
jgi:DNA-binding MarR family transcriptional regulator